MTASSLTGVLALPPWIRIRPLPPVAARGRAAPSAPPAMLPSAAWLSRPPAIPDAGAAARAAAGAPVAARRIAGLAEAQLGGTDRLPTRFASDMVADTVELRPAPSPPRSPAPSPLAGISMKARPSGVPNLRKFWIGKLTSSETSLNGVVSPVGPFIALNSVATVLAALGLPVIALSALLTNSLYWVSRLFRPSPIERRPNRPPPTRRRPPRWPTWPRWWSAEAR